jgi:hypothetical protein
MRKVIAWAIVAAIAVVAYILANQAGPVHK